jgi:phosphodiesterase/alkaline phosphatase D-like protein
MNGFSIMKLYVRTTAKFTGTHEDIPQLQLCLANCPNLMIYSDHEVRDNWGEFKAQLE